MLDVDMAAIRVVVVGMSAMVGCAYERAGYRAAVMLQADTVGRSECSSGGVDRKKVMVPS